MTDADVNALSDLLQHLEVEYHKGRRVLAQALLGRGVTIQHQPHPAPVEKPTCSTCKEFRPNPDGGLGGCREIGSPHGSHLAYLTVCYPEGSPLEAVFQPSRADLVISPSFGCVLHSDLTEAGA